MSTRGVMVVVAFGEKRVFFEAPPSKNNRLYVVYWESSLLLHAPVVIFQLEYKRALSRRISNLKTEPALKETRCCLVWGKWTN